MRWFLIALLLVPLGGCNSAKHQLAKCDRDARHAYPSPLQSPAHDDEVLQCMGINGYEHDSAKAGCAADASTGDHACYVPNHGLLLHY
ncbi:MAG TPA: hypothetical protein VIJ42_16720 [Stellaceae bacterium]